MQLSAPVEHAPATLEECAEVLRGAGRLAFVGGGTELGLGRAPTRLDAVVRTRRLDRILEHAPADLVLVAEAGVTLAAVQAAAGAHRQMLALDPPHPDRATIGGLCATGGFGPRRARYGGVRDLIIGVTLVRADGTIARGGGKVVKNVAGFDLPRLACGSLGTLAMIGTASFRLHPLPETAATLVAAGLTAGGVLELGATLRRAQLEPSSVVAIAAGGRFDAGVRFEGFERGVRQQVARLGELLACAPDEGFWARHDAVRAGGELRLKLAALPSRLPQVAPLAARLLGALRGGGFAWYATLGLGFVSGEVADAAAAASAIEAARAALVAAGGSLVVEEAPAAIRDAVDPWGPPPPSFAIMAELKRRFDPDMRLNPGRFVGGL
jgi:glycolate oxidase FAD binding subunit